MAIFIPVDVNATGAEFYTPERDTPGNKISYLLLIFFLKIVIVRLLQKKFFMY